MGLFDIAGELLGGAQGSNNQNALTTVLSMVNNHPGGLPGLTSAFEQNGLGGAVHSWVSPGANQPVSSEQVQSALGSDPIQEVASKLGVPPAMASSIVAEVLPGVVSHLTPNGQVPSSGSNLMEMGEGLFYEVVPSAGFKFKAD